MIKLKIDEVAKVYCSIIETCPDCGEPMTPLGDLGMDPYHFCFRCGIKIPFRTSEPLRSCISKETKQ